jgi:thiol:disulfide interchange protein DsbD
MNITRLLLPLFVLFACAAHAKEPLAPEQAYRYSARAIDAKTVEARWDIADGYYMYRDKFRFSVEPETVKLGQPDFPAGKMKDDENFGKVEIYRHAVIIRIPVEASGATAFTLKAVSQGCWEEGICYPPIPQQAVVDLSQPAGGDESSRIAGILKQGSFWLIITSFFGFGLLLALSPCVYPLVPILSGIIVSHGHALTHARAFWLSLTYVLGMAATYAVAGIAAGFSGTLLSNALQNAWVLGAFALIFVVLSLSMFGLYELQLPTALQSKLSEKANRQGGSFGAIAVMGALSALIVGPCVTPALAGALIYIAQTKNAALGGSALFAMALGMGMPLLLVGLFSRSLLPKVGPWMEAVRKFFGVLMLATALWLVAPVIPVWAQMFGWAALLIVPAIFLRAIDPLPPQSNHWQRFWKGIGVLLLLTGMAMLAGVLGGAKDPLQPLGFLRGAASTGSATPTLAFERIHSVAELDRRVAEAAMRSQPVMLDFYADWCTDCKDMEKLTFADVKVQARLAGVLLLQADVTETSEDSTALLKRFGLFGPPGIIFFGPDGKGTPSARVIGYQAPDKFLVSLDKALAP